MPQQIQISRLGGTELASSLQTALSRLRPKAIGFASAFVSVWGIDWIADLLRKCGGAQCRLVVGTSHYITHPEALRLAKQSGWGLRLGRSTAGIFHPKLLVAGNHFRHDGTIADLEFIYVGSANLTQRGLTMNTECGLLAEADVPIQSASDAFAHLWNSSDSADETVVRNYASMFAELSRKRSVSELEALELSDKTPATPSQTKELLVSKPPKRSAVTDVFAEAAWAGLQSFTGQYAFQVEFPRAAGEVVRRLVVRQATSRGHVNVLCTDSGAVRPMQFRYYADNSMFRLNIPNDVPKISWVRQHREGLAFIQRGPAGGAPVRLTIHPPGSEADEIVGRSLVLGTWGKTQTRLYGWF